MIEGVVLNVMGEMEVGIMICGVFCVPITRKKWRLFVGLICLIVLCAGGDWYKYDDLFILTMGVGIVPVIFWTFVTEGKLFRRLAVYICSTMCLGLPYTCIDLIYSLFLGKGVEISGEDVCYRFLRGILTIVAELVLVIILKRKIAQYKEIVRDIPSGYFIVGSVCAFAASMIHHFVESISREYENVQFANFISVCVILVNIMFYTLGVGSAVLDIFRKRYKEESLLKEQYLQIAGNYVKTVRDNAKETQKIRHDIQNHMGILRYQLENGEYQKAQEYLAKMQAHMERAIKKTVSVGHEIVDAVLSQMQSEGQGIRWEIAGILPPELPVGDFDLCTIFSNLLSNSIEACMQIEEEKRYIHLEIRRLGDNLLIEISNPASQRIEVGKLGSITSKKDDKNHGYGILNIKDAVHKNHGEVMFESTEDKFTAQVIFHLSEK